MPDLPLLTAADQVQEPLEVQELPEDPEALEALEDLEAPQEDLKAVRLRRKVPPGTELSQPRRSFKAGTSISRHPKAMQKMVRVDKVPRLCENFLCHFVSIERADPWQHPLLSM